MTKSAEFRPKTDGLTVVQCLQKNSGVITAITCRRGRRCRRRRQSAVTAHFRHTQMSWAAAPYAWADGRTDGRTARRDSLQTTCDCAYRRATHGRRRRLLLWSTPVISGAEWLICMREAPPAAPKHTGTACRLVVWLWLEARKQKLWWPGGKVWRAPGAAWQRWGARCHHLLPTVSGSDLTASCAAEQSRASPFCLHLFIFFYFVPSLFVLCSGSRGHGVTGVLPSCLGGVWGELHPGQSPLHHIQFYFDPFYYNRLILFVCIIEL